MTDQPQPVTRVVLVGHCVPDSALLKGLIQKCLGPVPVERVNESAGLAAATAPEALWLVNRVLDGAFDSDSGVELIRRIAAGPRAPRLMLVSNLADAQAAAVAAGALPGFGKKALGSAATPKLLQHAAGAAAGGGTAGTVNG